MSKKTKRIVSIVVLLGLGITAWWIASTEGYFSGNYSTLKKGLSDFSIKDTAQVDRIVVSIYDGKKVVLTKKKPGFWEVNNSFRARKDAVDQLLELAYQIRVRSTVGENARANVIKRISAYYKKVEYYVNGELEKTYYVGTGAPDNIGTYMVLETPDEGRSTEPYIMEIPGFSGVLDARIFAGEEDWRFTGIFNYDYHHITEIKITNHEKPLESFDLKITPRGLELYDGNGKKAPSLDSISARGYIMHYQKIHYENKARLLSKAQVDSMLRITPYYTIQVTDLNNETARVRLYHMPSRSGETNLDGTPLKWNPERAYAILPDGEAVVVQFHVFDKLLRSLQSFYANTK